MSTRETGKLTAQDYIARLEQIGAVIQAMNGVPHSEEEALSTWSDYDDVVNEFREHYPVEFNEYAESIRSEEKGKVDMSTTKRKPRVVKTEDDDVERFNLISSLIDRRMNWDMFDYEGSSEAAIQYIIKHYRRFASMKTETLRARQARYIFPNVVNKGE